MTAMARAPSSTPISRTEFAEIDLSRFLRVPLVPPPKSPKVALAADLDPVATRIEGFDFSEGSAFSVSTDSKDCALVDRPRREFQSFNSGIRRDLDRARVKTKRLRSFYRPLGASKSTAFLLGQVRRFVVESSF
tara:strand:- start:151 stop:552 length:402 start_codon:yes stop_codon:yes gene_type:complete